MMSNQTHRSPGDLVKYADWYFRAGCDRRMCPESRPRESDILLVLEVVPSDEYTMCTCFCFRSKDCFSFTDYVFESVDSQ
jgi:hypothetical protein